MNIGFKFMVIQQIFGKRKEPPYCESDLVPVYDLTNKTVYKRKSDLQVGDLVFNRKGEPVRVIKTHPPKLNNIYEIEFADGRVVYCGSDQLWTYIDSRNVKAGMWHIGNTESIAAEVLRGKQFLLPQSGEIQWAKQDHKVNPYVVGAFIGSGCMTLNTLTMTSSNTFVTEKCAKLIGAAGTAHNLRNNACCFVMPKTQKGRQYFKAFEVLPNMPEITGRYSHEKSVPEPYKRGSPEQRLELVQGLFDTNGSIGGSKGKYPHLKYYSSSEMLIYDVQDILFSLGVQSRITPHVQSNHGMKQGSAHINYFLTVRRSDADGDMFFTSPKKLAKNTAGVRHIPARMKPVSTLTVKAVRKLNRQELTGSITVNDAEHLYLTGQYIVQHDAEFTGGGISKLS